MSVGGRLLAACCANGGLSNTQIPTCPFTTIACSYTNTNNFSASGLVYESGRTVTNHPGCPTGSFTTSWDSIASGVNSYSLSNLGTGNARWDLASSTITTGTGGPVVRPGTNTVVAASLQFKFRRCLFNRVSRFRSYSLGSQVGSSTAYTVYGNCCPSSADSTSYVFDNYVTGTTTNQTTPSSAASYTIDWAGVASERVAGMTLVLTAAGLAAGPWVVEVAGGVLKLTNGAGTTTTYSGLLTAVRTSINAAGFFTATITAQARTPAETQDLKQSKSQPLSTACTHSLYIIDIGDLIAPGSGDGTVPPVRLSAGSPFLIQLRFDAAAEGLPNDVAGLESFLRRTWFPKLVSGGSTIGTLESASNSYLGLSNRWSTTSGSSSQSYNSSSFGTWNNTKTLSINEWNLVCASCTTGPPSGPFENQCYDFPGATLDIEGPNGLGPGSWDGCGLKDCSGAYIPGDTCPCTFIGDLLVVASYNTITPVSSDAPTFTGVETITGSFQIS